MPGLVPSKFGIDERAAEVADKFADAIFELAGSIDRLALAWDHHTTANQRAKTPRV